MATQGLLDCGPTSNQPEGREILGTGLMVELSCQVKQFNINHLVYKQFFYMIVKFAVNSLEKQLSQRLNHHCALIPRWQHLIWKDVILLLCAFVVEQQL